MEINDSEDDSANTNSVLRSSPSTDSGRGASIRPLGRALGATIPLWVISPEGRLIYASPACAAWTRVAISQLTDRSVFPSAGEEPTAFLDFVAKSLAPPVRNPLHVCSAVVQPPTPPGAAGSIEPRESTFVPLLQVDGGSPYILALAADLLKAPESVSAEAREWLHWISSHLAVEPRHSQTPLVMGSSLWAMRLRNQLLVAASNRSAHVMLLGPRGSGFATLAQLIYVSQQHSLASKGGPPAGAPGPEPEAFLGREVAAPLVRVAGSLMDAELFEATTGDVVRSYLETTADHAGILIEEIDQMPFDAQERLAQLVEFQGKRLRVFTTSTKTATELASHVQPALLATLCGIEIEIPPLALRHQDLPILATALLQRRHLAGETPAQGLSRDLLDRLINYPWPGNFDELVEAIRSAARLCTSTALQWEHLPLAIRTYGAISKDISVSLPKPQKLPPLDQALESFERGHILRALQQTSGNRAAAARLLQISRPRLIRRIEQLSIQWPPSPEQP